MAWSGSSLESSLSDASSRQLFSPLCRKTLLVSGLLPVSRGPRGGSAGTRVSFTALSILSMPHDSTEEVSPRPMLCTWTPARITAGFLELGRSSERLSLDSHPGLGSTECVATRRSPVSALARGSFRDVSPFAAWIPRIKTPFQSRQKYKQPPPPTPKPFQKHRVYAPSVRNESDRGIKGSCSWEKPAGPLWCFSSDRAPAGSRTCPLLVGHAWYRRPQVHPGSSMLAATGPGAGHLK